MKYGFFDDENREYVITRPDIPVSWTNYLGVKDLCTVISHNAGGYSFYKRAQQHRVTRFRANAVPMDRPGHYVYVRDDDTGAFWSISWQPVGKDLKQTNYSCRHGLSYSIFSSEVNSIEAAQTLFIPVEEDVELWDIKIKNKDGKPRNLSVFSYVEFSFHDIPSDSQNFQAGLYAFGSNYDQGVIEYDSFYQPDVYHYFASNFNPDGFDCLRDEFIGPYRTETNPIAVEKGLCSSSVSSSGNHCGVLHRKLKLKAGEDSRLVFMMGVGNREVGLKIKQKYSEFKQVDAAFAGIKAHWEKRLAAFQCKTPNAGLNTMINAWTLYQAETTVVWSRFASFVETGGRTGLGYRDTAQDVMSVPHTNPQKVRQRIVELLRAQCAQGYGLHLFQPEFFDPNNKVTEDKFKSPTIILGQNKGMFIHSAEEACSDDALWLIPSICEYVMESGELDFFNQKIPYADKGEDTVYGHLKAALDFSIEQVGQTGICKGLIADWNDCLNLGGGESSMTSFLHYWSLTIFAEAAAFLGKVEDEKKYTQAAEKVHEACEKELWDGDWYIRGLTAKGDKIGTQSNEQGKVHLESNSLAVLSGAATGERGKTAMDAVDKYLYCEWGLHLVWPAYSKRDDAIGFVTRVYPGVKENGAVFSHPNPWAIIAECRLGRGDRAMKFYDSLSPYRQNDMIETRRAEPYSYCQFVFGQDHPLHGQAKHPWLTGTAGWAYTAVTRWILGIRLSFKGLQVDPCIPKDWPGFEVTRQWRGAVFNIKVDNSAGVSKGVKQIKLNGAVLKGPIEPQAKDSINEVEVVMG